MRLSLGAAAGIRTSVKGVLLLGPATLIALGACQMSPLTSEGLFGQERHDAGTPDGVDASGGVDATDGVADRKASDGPTDETDAGDDGPADARDAVTVDASADGSPDGACAASCGPGTQCDPASDQCVLVNGEGMLSGIVTDRCDGHSLSALVGIAGRHQCSFAGKGAYFFSQLPLGTLELAAAKDGYMPFAQVIEVKAGGTVLDVKLTRATDPGCAGHAGW